MWVGLGFIGGFIAALVLVASAIGGLFARVLSGADDLDPDDDPMDMFPWSPPREA